MRGRSSLTACSWLALVLALPALASGQGGAGPAPAPAAPQPAPAPASPSTPEAPGALAARLFDEAARWVAKGGTATPVKDIALSLEARIDDDGVRHEGPMRLWLKLPDLYRQETTMANRTTTKVLKVDNLWIRSGTDPFTHVNRTADAATALAQAKADLSRLRDLTRFFTLESLKGPAVVFEWGGEEQREAGLPLLKVVRKAPGEPDMSFLFAAQHDAADRPHATHPAAVSVEGDPARDVPTEVFVLQQWQDAPLDQPRAYRFPRLILAYRNRPGQPSVNFLTARVNELKLDAGIDATRFEPR